MCAKHNTLRLNTHRIACTTISSGRYLWRLRSSICRNVHGEASKNYR